MSAQASLEFVALVSVLLVLLLMTIYYNSSFNVQIYTAETYSAAQMINDKIAYEINLALKSGDGYSRGFYIPYKISNAFDYNITVDNYLVTLKWSSGRTQSVILTKNITGDLKGGRNTIQNIEGGLYVG